MRQRWKQEREAGRKEDARGEATAEHGDGAIERESQTVGGTKGGDSEVGRKRGEETKLFTGSK